MEKQTKILFENVFDIDLEKDINDISKGFKNKIEKEKKFETQVHCGQEKNELAYIFDCDNNNQTTALCTLIGLPNEQYDRAEKDFWESIKDKEYKHYDLIGYGVGGALAQYVGIMSYDYLKNIDTMTYNAMGIGNLLKFNGNEFFSYAIGLSYYLNKLLYDNMSMDLFFNELINYEIIINGNINRRLRKNLGRSIKEKTLKDLLKNILHRSFEYPEERAESFVEQSFNINIIERKMHLIDKYQQINDDIKKESFINYTMSDNIPARLIKHLGSSYLVDMDLKKFTGGMGEDLLEKISKLDEENIDTIITNEKDIFLPFLHSKENGNGPSARNRLRKKAEVGQITDRLSHDYLRSLIKDIIMELKSIDEKLLLELFKTARRRGEREVLNLIEDRLRYSMKLRGLINEEDLSYISPLLIKRSDLFANAEHIP